MASALPSRPVGTSWTCTPVDATTAMCTLPALACAHLGHAARVRAGVRRLARWRAQPRHQGQRRSDRWHACDRHPDRTALVEPGRDRRRRRCSPAPWWAPSRTTRARSCSCRWRTPEAPPLATSHCASSARPTSPPACSSRWRLHRSPTGPARTTATACCAPRRRSCPARHYPLPLRVTVPALAGASTPITDVDLTTALTVVGADGTVSAPLTVRSAPGLVSVDLTSPTSVDAGLDRVVGASMKNVGGTTLRDVGAHGRPAGRRHRHRPRRRPRLDLRAGERRRRLHGRLAGPRREHAPEPGPEGRRYRDR